MFFFTLFWEKDLHINNSRASKGSRIFPLRKILQRGKYLTSSTLTLFIMYLYLAGGGVKYTHWLCSSIGPNYLLLCWQRKYFSIGISLT